MTAFRNHSLLISLQNVKYFWNTFPQVIKEKIFQHLTYKDIMRTSFACKDLYRELGRSQVSMDKIQFRVKDDLSADVHKILTDSPRKYTSINIYSDGEMLKNT